jgi:hypothetical protein
MDSMKLFDVHTHLGSEGRPRQARNLAHIVSYHWMNLELIRAGATTPHDGHPKSPDDHMKAVAPYFSQLRNTSNHYCLIGMLRDLYGFTERTITPDNWKELDKKVQEHANDPSWISHVLDKANIKRLSVAYKDGMPDESDRFVPYHYGEYLFAPSTTLRLNDLGEITNETLTTTTALRAAIEREIDKLANEHGVRLLHIWIRDSWEYMHCSESEAQEFLNRIWVSRSLGTEEENRLISFGADLVADAAAKHKMAIQLFHGMDYYTPEVPRCVCSYYHPGFLRSLPRYALAHPAVNFDVFLATRIPSHEAASLSRAACNLSMSGGWWHGFTPTTLSTFFRDRLEMLPHTSWNAFFSDGYIVEWIYAKQLLTKNRLACALGDMVDEGFLTEQEAPEIAQVLLYDNGRRIYRI